MKVVSKRAPGGRVLDDVARLQRTLNRLRGHRLVPRGLYRFSSFEEADRWMMSQIARSAAHLSSKTSSPSAARSARMKDTVRSSDKMDVGFLRWRIEDETE